MCDVSRKFDCHRKLSWKNEYEIEDISVAAGVNRGKNYNRNLNAKIWLIKTNKYTASV